jgi:hypothetical protein
MSTVTMEELELETAELLPARETLCSYRSPHSSTNIDSGNGNGDGNGNFNFGLVNILSGDNGNLNGNTVVL